MSKFVLTAQLQLQPPNNVGQVVKNLQSQLNSVHVNVKAQGAQQAQKQIQQLSSTMKTANKEAKGLGDSLQISVRRFAGLAIATRAVSLFTNTLGGAIKDAISFERQLVKISQVTGKTMGNLRDLTNEITRLSTNFGVAADALLNVSRVLSQAGLNANQTRIALDALAKSDLAPTFDDITQTAEGAVAIFNQFKQGAGALEGQLGSLNAVAGQFAVEAGDLIAVIRRTGGVFKQAGGDLNELVALFTSVRSTTRESAESIATGLRTIFTRIQRPETIKYLQQFGVQLTDLEGKFIGPYKAVGELSKALAGLEEGDLRFVEIAEQLGGFRQIGKVLPLIKEYSVAQRALAVAQAGSNSLAEDAAKAQQTLAVRIQNVAGEFAALVRSISETGTFQAMANTALTLASALIKIGEAVKPLIPLLGALAAIKLVKGMQGMMGGMASMAGGGKGVMGFNRGGVVPGSGNGDTVPAMLTPGEFVIKKSSVQKLGASNLERMNNNKYARGGKIEMEKGAIGGFFLRPGQGEDRDGKINDEVEITNSAVLKKLGKLKSAKDTSKRGTELNAYANSLTRQQQFERGLISSPDATKYTPGKGKGFNNASLSGNLSKGTKTTKAKVEAAFKKDMEDGSATVGAQMIPLSGTIEGFFPGAREGNTPEIANLVKAQTERGLKATINSTVSKIKQQGLINAPPITPDAKAKLNSSLDNLFVAGGASDAIEGFVNEGIISSITGAELAGGTSRFDFPSAGIANAKKGLKAMYGEGTNDIDALIKADAKRTASGATFNSIADKLVSDINKGNTEGLKGFATGGPVGTDTVPALLTPGEFVVNRASAKKIGYGSLNRMNKVAKYADGGVVQKFAGGTTGTGVKPVASSGIATGSAGLNVDALQQAWNRLETDVKSHSIVIQESKAASERLYKQEDELTKRIRSVDDSMIKLGEGAEDGAKGEKAMKRATDLKVKLETKRMAVAEKAIAMDEKAAVYEKNKQEAIPRARAAKQEFMSASQGQAIRSPLKGNIGNSGGGPPNMPPSGGGGSPVTKDNTDKLKKNTMSLEAMFMGVMAVNSATSMLRPTIDATSGSFATGSAAILDSFGAVASQGLMLATALQKLGVEANVENFKGLFDTTGKSKVMGKIGGVARGAGEKIAGRFGAGPEQAAAFGQGLGKAAQMITPYVAALGTSVAAIGILNNAIETFYNYTQRINKAIEEGNVEEAGDAAAGQASMKNANSARMAGGSIGALIGTAIAPGIGTAIGAALGASLGGVANFAGTIASYIPIIGPMFSFAADSARAMAEAQAGNVKIAKELETSMKATNEEMQKFKDGNATAADVLNKLTPAAEATADQLNRTQAFDDRGIMNGYANRESGGIESFARGSARVLTGGLAGLAGLESGAQKNSRIKEQEKISAQADKGAAEFISSSDPAIKVFMTQVAAAGGDLDDFKDSIQKNTAMGKPYLDAVGKMDDGMENLAIKFDNIAKETERTRAAIEAMTLGMASVNGAANAAAMGLDNFLSSQEAGYSSLSNSLSVLENGVTGAANNISTADFNAALGEASGTLRGFGATNDQINKFEANMKGVNAVQQQLPESFKTAQNDLKAAAAKGLSGGGTGTSQKDAVIDVLVKDIKSMNLGAEVEKNILAGIENMDLSQAELEQIELGNFDVLEKKIGDIGGKQLEQVRNAIQKQIEMQKKLNAVVSRRLQLEDQYVKAQQRGISMILEMQEIQAKHGGAAVSPAMREQAAIDAYNVESEAAGVAGITSGSPDQILRSIQNTSAGITAANDVRMDAAGGGDGLAGEAGVEAAKNQERLNGLQKAQYDLTKNLISIKQQELSTIKEKNKLERDAMDALIGGDIEGFFDSMATQSAQAAIASGDTAAMNMMGGQAIGRAAQENKRLQDAGVTELYGQKLAGPGGLTERGFQAVSDNVGIADSSFAKASAGTTLEENDLNKGIRDLAANMQPLAKAMEESAKGDLEVGKAIEDGARKLMKAGEVLESAGKALGGSDVGETAEGGAGAGAKSATVKAQTANINVQKVNAGGTGGDGGGGGIAGSVSSMVQRSPATALQAGKMGLQAGIPAATSAATKLRAGYDMSKMGMSTKNMSGLTKAGGMFQQGGSQVQKFGSKVADFGSDVASTVRTKAGNFGTKMAERGQRLGTKAADMASDAKAGFNTGGKLGYFERSVMSADDIAAADKATSTVGGKMGSRAREALGRGKDFATKTADRVMGAKNVDKLASRTKGLVDSGRSMAGRVGNSRFAQGTKDLVSNAYKGGKGFVSNVSQGMKYAKVANQMGPMGPTDELVRAGVQKTVGGRMGAGAQKLMTKGTDLATKYAPTLSKGAGRAAGAGGKLLGKALGPGMAVADLAMGAYKGATSDSNVRAAKDEEGNVVGPGLVADRVLDKQSTLQKGAAGMLTGSATVGGSITGSLLGVQEGGTADQVMAGYESMGRGAAIGASIGSVIPGAGTAVGAGVGAVVGGGAELLKSTDQLRVEQKAAAEQQAKTENMRTASIDNSGLDVLERNKAKEQARLQDEMAMAQSSGNTQEQERIQSRLAEEEQVRRSKRKENRSYFSAFTDSVGITDTTADTEEYKQYQQNQRKAGASPAAAGAVPAQSQPAAQGQMPAEAGAVGIDPEVLNAFSASLDKFNTDLSANIDRLENTKLEIKLADTNVSVNINDGGVLQKLTQLMGDTVSQKIEEKLAETRQNPDGSQAASSSSQLAQ